MRNAHCKMPSVLITPSDATHIVPASLLLQAGDQSLDVQVKLEKPYVQENDNRVKLSLGAARALGIPTGRYNILSRHDNKIKIGPLVAILTSGSPKHPAPANKKIRMFKDFILKGWKDGIFIYYFFPEDIIWGRGVIHGYTYTPQGKWVSGNYPLPDIVYNRILYRYIENQKGVQKLLERFDRHPGIYLFNRRFLNKWEVYRVLGNDDYTKGWIPETKSYNKPNLRELLLRHQELFLKPCHSSKGLGIVKIERFGGKGYRYARTEWKGQNWIKVPNYSQLNSKLKHHTADYKNYVIQQGVPLARLQGRVFDLRAQAQKNGQGQWVLTGVGVRIAARNRFVTHVPNGGSRADFQEVIQKVFCSPAIQNSIEEELDKICRVVPEVLERKLGISLGVLSLDIGVDSSGRLWILELNSKPARFDEGDIRQRHQRLLLDYFVFAAKENCKGR